MPKKILFESAKYLLCRVIRKNNYILKNKDMALEKVIDFSYSEGSINITNLINLKKKSIKLKEFKFYKRNKSGDFFYDDKIEKFNSSLALSILKDLEVLV